MWPRRLRVCTALSQNIHSLQLSKLNAGTKERKNLKCLDFVNILSLLYLVIQIHLLVAKLLNDAFTLSQGILHGTTLCSNKGFSYMRMSKISSLVAHIFKHIKKYTHNNFKVSKRRTFLTSKFGSTHCNLLTSFKIKMKPCQSTIQ